MASDILYEKALAEVYHFYEMGRYDTVIDKLNKLLANRPNDGELLYIKAECMFYYDRYDEAADCCKTALAHDFSPCECNDLLGRIYIETEKLTCAEECFLEALRIEPQRADIMAAYGYLMLKAGQKNKARQLLEEALKIDPENEIVLHYNFFYHLIVNKKDKQIAALGEYIKTSGNEERKLVKAGIMEYCNGNFKAAYESLRQAYLLNPTDEGILEILQIAEEESNLLYFPQRIINKIGGPIVLWIATIAIFIIFYLLHMYKAAIITAINYIILYAYMKITPILCKAIIKRNLL